MFNKIKLIVYKFLYSNDSKSVLGKLTDCEAYQTFQKTKESTVNAENKIYNFIMNEIDFHIERASHDGKYNVQLRFYYPEHQKKEYKIQLKKVKNIFINKGYSFRIIPGLIRYNVNISWKGWV